VRRRGWFVLFSLSLLTAIAFAAGPAQAQDSVDDCLGILQSVQSDGLALDVNNSCDRSLNCSISWTLKCEDDKGKVTAQTGSSTRFLIARADSKKVFGSADACKKAAGWEIDGVTWSCNPVK
jgi:hypothetical protein